MSLEHSLLVKIHGDFLHEKRFSRFFLFPLPFLLILKEASCSIFLQLVNLLSLSILGSMLPELVKNLSEVLSPKDKNSQHHLFANIFV